MEEVTDDVRTRKYSGRMVGANLIRKTFDLQIGDQEDGATISGKVDDDVIEDLEIMFGELCTATIEVRESALRSGETREHFTLLELTD